MNSTLYKSLQWSAVVSSALFTGVALGINIGGNYTKSVVNHSIRFNDLNRRMSF